MGKAKRTRAENGQRENNQRAVDHGSEELATRAEPAIARALTGGKSSSLTSEQAHRIEAAVARAKDAGRPISTAELVREARR